MRHLPLVVATLLLAGCGQLAAPPAAKLAAPAALAASPASAAAAPGRVEIRLAGLPATGARKLMATVAEVAALKVTISGGPLAAPRTQTVAAAALAAGKGTVAFDAVPAGSVAVSIQALDAAGAKIGEQTSSATVARGQTAVVAVTLKLQDTHVASENGNLAVDLAIQDGDVVVDPIASASPTPTPSPSAPAYAINLVDDLTRTWHADGTITAKGAIRNDGQTTRDVTITIRWYRPGLLGENTIEEQPLTWAAVPPGATRSFTATSKKSIKGLFSKGEVEAWLPE